MSDAAAMMQRMRAMLQEAGMPITTDNLNRASLAMARGEMLQAEAPRSVQSSERRSQRPAPVVGQGGGFAGEQNPLEAAVNAQVAATTAQSAMIPEDTNERVAAANAQPPRRGTVNTAQRIEGYDTATDANAADVAMSGMFAGTPARQADETGVDPMGLANALMLPFAALLPSLAAPGMRPLGVTLNRPQLTGPGGTTLPRGGASSAPLPGGGMPPALPSPAQALSATTPPARLPWTTPRVYNQSTGNTADDVATMLTDAARTGNQRGQEVLLGSLRGPTAIAERAARTRSGGPRGQRSARTNNE